MILHLSKYHIVRDHMSRLNNRTVNVHLVIRYLHTVSKMGKTVTYHVN